MLTSAKALTRGNVLLERARAAHGSVRRRERVLEEPLQPAGARAGVFCVHRARHRQQTSHFACGGAAVPPDEVFPNVVRAVEERSGEHQ
eukprot:3483513-Rhodomonas_salina.1